VSPVGVRPSIRLCFAVCSLVLFSACATGSETTSLKFETLPPGSDLPGGAECSELALGQTSDEIRPENDQMNQKTIDGLVVDIDGADEVWNDALSTRIDGDFTGTTEQILKWGACKWGFDEDLTFARAWAESSWQSELPGDRTEDQTLCDLIQLAAPCFQSFGLLQVKGTVHTGTYPASTESTAFGVDYAMAWKRACFEGSFEWLQTEGREPYGAGNEMGCTGAWFSGEWWDEPAIDYVDDVKFHLASRTWENDLN